MQVEAMQEHVKAAEVHGEETRALRKALAPLLLPDTAAAAATRDAGATGGGGSMSRGRYHARELASRLVGLSEESRRQKLELLRLRGQVGDAQNAAPPRTPRATSPSSLPPSLPCMAAV